jgi:hypothetical protein
LRGLLLRQTPKGKSRAGNESPNASPLDAATPNCLIWETVHASRRIKLLLEARLPEIHPKQKKKNPARQQPRDENPRERMSNGFIASKKLAHGMPRTYPNGLTMDCGLR